MYRWIGRDFFAKGPGCFHLRFAKLRRTGAVSKGHACPAVALAEAGLLDDEYIDALCRYIIDSTAGVVLGLTCLEG